MPNPATELLSACGLLAGPSLPQGGDVTGQAESRRLQTSDPTPRLELRHITKNYPVCLANDRIDLMVGLFAEAPPKGCGFSDTAFRVFVLMASRRLKSDRFFTTDYTPAVYTQAGLDWIAATEMKHVLLRHYPALAPAIQRVGNAFAPWDRVTAAP